MSNVAEQLQSEIERVEREMDDQRHLIRRATDNQPVFEAAEAHLKELHTRLAVLKGNLKQLKIAGPEAVNK